MAETQGNPYASQAPLPLAEDGYGSIGYWNEQITGAKEKVDTYKDEWNRNVQSYLTKMLDKVADQDRVVVPLDFANIESKKAGLFFQTPEVQLTAKQPGLEDAIAIFQAVIEHQVSPDGVDALGMMREVLFDALCPSGLMISKIGYESFEDGMIEVPTGEMQPDPNAAPQPGSVLGLQPVPQVPVTAPAPNVVFERYFWRRISPAKILIPTDFKGGNYDRAPWLGFEFDLDWEVAKNIYDLSDETQAKLHTDDDRVLKSEKDGGNRASKRVRGWEIWYYTYCYDPTVKHPEAMRLLVILEGIN